MPVAPVASENLKKVEFASSHKVYLTDQNIILLRNNIPPTPIRKIQTGNYLIRITNRNWKEIMKLKPGWRFFEFHDFTSGHWIVNIPSDGRNYIFHSKEHLKYIPSDSLIQAFS